MKPCFTFGFFSFFHLYEQEIYLSLNLKKIHLNILCMWFSMLFSFNLLDRSFVFSVDEFLNVCFSYLIQLNKNSSCKQSNSNKIIKLDQTIPALWFDWILTLIFLNVCFVFILMAYDTWNSFVFVYVWVWYISVSFSVSMFIFLCSMFDGNEKF